jgi:hypothetical protein
MIGLPSALYRASFERENVSTLNVVCSHEVKRRKGEKGQRGKRHSPFLLFAFSPLLFSVFGNVSTFNV